MSAHSGHYRYARDGMQIAHALFALKAEGARGVGCHVERVAEGRSITKVRAVPSAVRIVE